MDQQEKANWERVKDELEKEGKTDSYFYKRAVAICNGEDDPLEPLK